MKENAGLTSESQPSVQFRVIVVAIIQNERDDYLICRMPKDRGVFPDQWGLPGGGIEEGERMEAALRREVREELGVGISDIKPLFFKDGQHIKSFTGGRKQEVYMIFLIFSCRINTDDEIKLSPEFAEYAWVRKNSLEDYNLNSATTETFRQVGIL